MRFTKQSLTVLMAGMLVMLSGSVIYTWSTLSTPIRVEYPDWSESTISLAYTISIITFGIGQLCAGGLLRKISPGKLLALSALLFGAGFILSSQACTAAALYIFYGCFCGIGTGFIFITVLSTVVLWFEHSRGLINGLLLLSYGLGSSLVGKLFQMITLEYSGGWRYSFLVFGIGFAALLVFGSLLIREPREWELPLQETGADSGNLRGNTPREVLHDWSFYVVYLWLMLATAAGMVIMSQSGRMISDIDPGLSYSAVTAISGVLFIAGAVGRLLGGILFDRIGRTKLMLLVEILIAGFALLLLAARITGSHTLIIIAFVCGGYAYGCLTPCNTTYLSSRYGMKYYSVNLSMLNTVLFPTSLSSTLAASIRDQAGSYQWIYYGLLLMAVIGAACVLFLPKETTYYGSEKNITGQCKSA